MSVPSAVFFAGSRGLPSSPVVARSVSRIVGRVLQSGSRVLVGCCSGADHLVLSSAGAVGGLASCSVYCAFGPGGVGAAGGASAVSAVAAAAAGGASVSYWSGGSASVPVRARLVRRSRVAAAAGAALGAPCVLFLAAPSSRGSLAAAAVAAAAGAPVFAFCFWRGACAAPPAPLPGLVGSWALGRFAGGRCWRWVSASSPLF